MPVRLRVSTPADLVATLPYTFGFVPSESIIAMALDGRHVKASCRINAEAADDPEALAALCRAVVTHGSALIIVAWIDCVEQAERALLAASKALGCADQTIIVSHGRCRVDGGEWVDCPIGLQQADKAGLTVLPSRQAVVDQVAGPGRRDKVAARRWSAARVMVMAHTAQWRRARGKALLKRGVTDCELPVDDSFELAALVREGDVRDGLWTELTNQTAAQHVAVWKDVVTVVPDQGAAAPLGLLAMAAWLAGEPALANCCLERGLGIEKEHSLLRLVDCIIASGTHPKLWPDMRRSLLGLACV